jgi:D-alanyl-lipoteichoic acid acyltransferase DltB (MBOAT superfamily)
MKDKPKRKKIWLLITLIINAGILIFFKYTDFLRSIYFDGINLFGNQNLSFEPFRIILPLGISFYTFQAIAYSVDVYRETIEPDRSFEEFSLFLLFFPQLVAGPIMRANVLIPQFKGKKLFDNENFAKGMTLIALGIFKKTFIADPISTVIEPIYKNPGNYDALTCFFGILLFTIQIYCDFGGYSDIAIGAGKILGFEIPTNFNRPYFSSSATELWRRWHISLSTWLRDYIYIPLGGSRVSISRNYFNVFITMVIGGIWHGAAWTFIIWGTWHAIVLTIEKYFIDKGYSKIFEKVPHVVCVIYAFFIFAFGAHFFRAESMHKAILAIRQILYFSDGNTVLPGTEIMIPILILFFYELLQELGIWKKISGKEFVKFLQRPIVYAIILAAGMVYTVSVSPQFYYFQF